MAKKVEFTGYEMVSEMQRNCGVDWNILKLL